MLTQYLNGFLKTFTALNLHKHGKKIVPKIVLYDWYKLSEMMYTRPALNMMVKKINVLD